MSMISKYAVARQAAARLTTRHVGAVAARYVEWIDAQPDEQQAIDALLASATRSKDVDTVLVMAAQAYAEIPNEPDSVINEEYLRATYVARSTQSLQPPTLATPPP